MKEKILFTGIFLDLPTEKNSMKRFIEIMINEDIQDKITKQNHHLQYIVSKNRHLQYIQYAVYVVYNLSVFILMVLIFHALNLEYFS